MSADIEHRLNDYAHKLIVDHVKAEYELQINKWKRSINLAADAYLEAFENHEKVLTEVNRQKQANWELGMLVFSLVSGWAISWAGAFLQYKLAPKLLGKTKLRYQKVQLFENEAMNWLPGKSTKQLVTSEIEYSKIKAKMFGAIGTSLLSAVSDEMVRSTKPKDLVNEGLNQLVQSKQGSFKTNLENALLNEAEKITKHLMSLGLFILNWDGYGKYYLKLESIRKLRNSADKERKAKEMILDELWADRKLWAKRWFYFGHDPNFLTYEEMVKTYEREIWAFWLLEQEIYWKRGQYVSAYRGNNSGSKTWVKGSASKSINHEILYRMAELDIISGQTDWQVIRQHKRLMTAKKKGSVLVSGIVGKIDTSKEVRSINSWAKNHNPDFISGGVLSVKREILRDLQSNYN